MNLAQAVDIAGVVATKIEVRAAGMKDNPMKCESCGEMGAACTCDKIAAGGPGSGRHKEMQDIAKEKGYEKSSGNLMHRSSSLATPASGDHFLRVYPNGDWEHTHVGNVSNRTTTGKGPESLRQHLTKIH